METILGDILLESTTPALLLSAGLLMGLLHVLEPDHVAAMLTQAKTGGSGRRRKMAVRNSLLGAFWGLGHTSAILLVGVLVFVLSMSIPALVFGWFEVAAGAMIITLGALVLAGRSLGRMHSHIHSHDDGTVHSHPHDDAGEHLHSHRSYLIGCVHGLAGSGILIALGISATGAVDSFLYFAIIFGAGSVMSMVVISGLMSLPLSVVGNTRRAARAVRMATGCASIAIGAWVVYEIAAGWNMIGSIT